MILVFLIFIFFGGYVVRGSANNFRTIRVDNDRAYKTSGVFKETQAEKLRS